jgi:pimeloyl-ACP methyl ester carboxylesterase
MKHTLKIVRQLGLGLLAFVVLIVLFFAIGNYLWDSVYNNLDDVQAPTQQELAELGINTINANGLQFAYLAEGDPNNPLVLLVHGFPDTAYTFEDVLPVLAEQGYYAVAYFQRGYYPSDIPEDSDYTVYTLGEDVIALIDAFGQDDAIVIGHDWGAANLAPERISKLVVIAIPHPSVVIANFDTFQRAPHFLELQFGFVSQWIASRNDFEYISDLYTYLAPNWDVRAMHMNRIRDDFRRPGRLKAAMSYYSSFFRDATNQEHLALYNQQTTVATLAFAGEEDGAFDITVFENMEGAFTNYYRFVRIPVAGHFVHQEAPDIFIEELFAFLELDSYE